MAIDFLHELRWRGLLHEATPGVGELLAAGPVTGYIGFDPTADSLHVGNLVPIMMLVHFQRCGHIPVALVGGATGMVGDPSGKKAERQLLDEDTLRHNTACIRAQLARFIDFDRGGAQLVNNYDWFKDIGFLAFIRDVGKHITVNYMMAKDSVKNRLETGISFTEFSYQLVQGYDFVHLHRALGVRLQMGGSDQWGNITTGTELIRRMGGGEAHAITNVLITKADGSKFGKSEGGNVWLDARRTSPYRFYQFWLNTSDADAERYVRIFTTWTQAEVEARVAEHAKAPHLRQLQKALAEDLTRRLHGQQELDSAVQATALIFGQAGPEALATLTDQQWTDVFEGVPQAEVPRALLNDGLPIADLLSDRTGFLSSKGEARRALREGSIAVNKVKAAEDRTVNAQDLLGGRYLLLQRGKKNYFLVKAVG
ncbi:MAG: tyrosine--tRNA ligase [Flavobacteriales bacterium]|jgi:tyrosyl-tRNA synthetase|nr:tyrosine--tRNA ligase [Flavobacteriales bacterium]MBK7942661.1 tyrosine--tRNA ligase [Flavobacteriales bacterium]MBK9698936.1 tyrosine--tRNA ligase [Flavobacteriales bacterium]